MKRQIQVSKTSNVLLIFIADSSSSSGAGLTGLLFNAAGLTGYYKRTNGTASVAITLATITTLGTFASGGLKEVDATNLPGLYEFHPPDACFASGAQSVVIGLKGATNMVPTYLEIELIAVDFQDAVRSGMTAFPAVVSGNAGAVLVSGTGTAALSVSSGIAQADVARINAIADSAARLQRAVQGTVLGTVGTSSSTTTINTTALDPTPTVTDQFKGKIVTFKNDTTTAALRGQATDITGSSSGGVLTVTALTTAPASGDTFVIS